MSKSLTTLAIEHDHLDGHNQISVCTGLEVASDDAAAWAEYGDSGKEDVDVALAYLRGVLGRLAAIAADGMAAEAHDHRCRRYFRAVAEMTLRAACAATRQLWRRIGRRTVSTRSTTSRLRRGRMIVRGRVGPGARRGRR